MSDETTQGNAPALVAARTELVEVREKVRATIVFGDGVSALEALAAITAALQSDAFITMADVSSVSVHTRREIAR